MRPFYFLENSFFRNSSKYQIVGTRGSYPLYPEQHFPRNPLISIPTHISKPEIFVFHVFLSSLINIILLFF